MVLRNSISNTKKFFQNTINNFKSLFSNNGTYQKLPKTLNNHTPIHNHHSKPTSSSSIQNQFKPKPRHSVPRNRALTQQPRGQRDDDDTLFSKPKAELVHQKLKEMVKIMNDNDMLCDEEHVSDVKEFLYCYSRLRYTAYLDVVERYFLEVYSDFFSPQLLGHSRKAVGHPRWS